MFDLEVKRSLVWKRLGIPTPEEGAELREEFETVYTRARAALAPAHSRRRFDVVAAWGRRLELAPGAFFESGDLVKLAAGAEAVIAMAATVGEELEALGEEFGEQGETFAMTVVDAVGSVAAEELISRVHADARAEAERAGAAVTRRLSPGYGDFELASQELLLELSGGSDLGITLTDNYMMIPRKSVTAVAAVKAL